MEANKNYLGFMLVDYEDGDASTFKGLKLSFGNGDVMLFNSGDPLIDWYDYCKYIYGGGAIEDGVISIAHSSNVDHWFMDTDEYVEKYLKLIDDEHYDFMTKSDLNKLSLSEMKTKLKCIVRKDMKSFQELKNYYYVNKKTI